MGVLSNKIDRKQLKPGDQIYSWRQAYLYAHHGIYVGEGMVIHFTTGRGQQNGTPAIFDGLFTSSAPSFDTDIPCLRCGDCREIRTNGVISSCLDCFLSGGELYLFEYGVNIIQFLAQARGGTCTLASSDPTDEVLSRTFYLLENGFGDYHFFKNNCEDFAIYCKTGLLVTPNISVAGGSGQAATYSAAVNSIAAFSRRFVTSKFTSSFYGMTLVSCGTYCYKRLVSDIGFRNGVTKVPLEKIPEMAKAEN
ncbi:protein LEAD-SENSITIVE 1-like [Trifolium pratense]|uniref:protein LEAD-SENSITIVE 1-like n=1 Tax=Trifolium pratense TaxID=57577 RepID=UPI001E69754E|nr:protein LEAD-SENSITIVE 1-like [Trifolium pratense]XP_045820530.1 protein LEAD-SENSITIVE 1-like [Trifolium pratense]XP_045820531.1 protein LEAD-SENSITIVE 1-like [Trifolium pratense]XP_045820532.1 protein LEAD-SENSITIVE 1-like [Trifolium pratense]XP_045820533.1 protein LEAD-SENSITIVE 1-like [Trifolium pratense]XP_045820534.1 protein LEAD-SENSITIVE 1-like [Trifolium pratense]